MATNLYRRFSERKYPIGDSPHYEYEHKEERGALYAPQ